MWRAKRSRKQRPQKECPQKECPQKQHPRKQCPLKQRPQKQPGEASQRRTRQAPQRRRTRRRKHGGRSTQASPGTTVPRHSPRADRRSRDLGRPLLVVGPMVGEVLEGLGRAPCGYGAAPVQARDRLATARRKTGDRRQSAPRERGEDRAEAGKRLGRVIHSTNCVIRNTPRQPLSTTLCWLGLDSLRVCRIVLHVTRSGLDHLRSAVRRHVEREGLRPFSGRTGIPVGQLRSLLQGRAALSTTLERVSAALGLEFYIGPPRKPDAARARRGYEGQAVRERPPSDEEAAPAWAARLQRELRAGLREDLAQVLRELTDATRDAAHPRRPTAGSS